MTRAALVGAVEFNAEHFHALDFDAVLAVDRGFLTCQSHGIDPDIVLGDFDSLGYVPNGLNVQSHPSEKDESDMELALHAAGGRGADEVFLYGALGQRLDHTLANLQLMAGQAKRGVRIAAIGPDYAVVALSGGKGRCNQLSFDAFDPMQLEGPLGPCISVFAFGGDALGVTERGLKYSLVGAHLSCTSSLGLSNEFTGQPACVSVEEGVLLVVFASGAWPGVSHPFAS